MCYICSHPVYHLGSKPSLSIKSQWCLCFDILNMLNMGKSTINKFQKIHKQKRIYVSQKVLIVCYELFIVDSKTTETSFVNHATQYNKKTKHVN